MLSNNVPSFIEHNDRRFFVSQWDTGLRGDEKKAYFDSYISRLESGGYEAIAGLLQQKAIGYDLFREAMSTREKLQAQNLASDECVEAIKALLEDIPKNTLFLPQDFLFIWDDHNIRVSQQKHKLTAAGLKKISGRVQIDSKRLSGLWMFVKSDLLTEKGQKPRVEMNEGLTSDAVRFKVKNACLDWPASAVSDSAVD